MVSTGDQSQDVSEESPSLNSENTKNSSTEAQNTENTNTEQENDEEDQLPDDLQNILHILEHYCEGGRIIRENEDESMDDSKTTQNESADNNEKNEDTEKDESGSTQPAAKKAKTTKKREEKAMIVRLSAAIMAIAERRGLEPKDLHRVAMLVVNDALDLNVRLKLAHTMIPRTRIERDTIVELLGGFSSYSTDLRQWIIKWIHIVHSLSLSPVSIIRTMYSVFFYYLQDTTLLPSLCQLLALITEKNDVTAYRIRKLHSLFVEQKHQPYLMTLLAKFKEFSPDNVVLPKGAPYVSKIPDLKWHKTLLAVQGKLENENNNNNNNNNNNDNDIVMEDIPLKATVTHRRAKPQYIIPVPRLFTTNTTFDISWLERQIESRLVIGGDETEAVPQMASLLHHDSRSLRHFVSLSSHSPLSLSAAPRLGQWLRSVLDQEFWSPQEEAKKGKLLSGLVELSHFYQENSPIVEDFLDQILRTWDGYTYQETVLHLITLIAPCPYEYLYAKYLQSISKLFFMVDTVAKGRIFASLIGLLKHWLTLDWKTAFDPSSKYGVFSRKPIPNMDHFKTIDKLIEYLGQLGTLALATENDHPIIQHHVLALWEEVTKMHRVHKFPYGVPPMQEMVYRFLLSSNTLAVDKMCGILVRCADEFAALKSMRGAQFLPKGLATLNAYTWDFSLALYFGNVLRPETKKQTSNRTLDANFGLDIRLVAEIQNTDEQTFYTVQQALTITHGIAFASIFYQFLFKSGLDNMQSSDISNETKIEYLEFIKEMGWTGVYDFLYNSVGNLKKQKNKKKVDENNNNAPTTPGTYPS